MKKIWGKNGKSRPKSRHTNDEASLAPSETDLASLAQVCLLIQPGYDNKSFKHAWVNGVLNGLSREFSESQLKLYRLELRGSHLYFYRPPSLLEVRLFKFDSFENLPLAETLSANSMNKTSLDLSLYGSTIAAPSINATYNYDTSIVSTAADVDNTRSRPVTSAASIVSSSTMSTPILDSSPTINDEIIKFYKAQIPHPDLKFDFPSKQFLPNSPPEALAHFFLFAEADTMEAPLRALLCVIPMSPDFISILSSIHAIIAAVYDGSFGLLVSKLEPTERVFQLFDHIDLHYGGFFLKTDTASSLLKLLEYLMKNAPPESAEKIAKFKTAMKARQEQLLELVSPCTSVVSDNVLQELNFSTFLNDMGLFEFAQAVTEIDLTFFKLWNSSMDKSLLLSSSIGDTLYKNNPLIFHNKTHVHYLSRLLVHHLFSEDTNSTDELRARVLEKWIDLGCLLDKLGNMSLWLGISSVILSQPVLRLTSVWRYVSEDYITLLRKDWSLVLFELDRRHLATPFESVTFGSMLGTDIQTSFKDSFHIMAPRGLGKIYPKTQIIPFFGDLRVNNATLPSIEELASVWNKIDYSFDRWNEYLESLQDSTDLIKYNQRVLRHYDANGFIFSNQSLNQVLCLGAQKDLSSDLPQTFATDSIETMEPPKIPVPILKSKLYKLIGLNCDSISMNTIMEYSLKLEAPPPENYLHGADWQFQNNGATSFNSDSQSVFNEFLDNDNVSVLSSRLSGTKSEERLPLFISQGLKINFDSMNSSFDPNDIAVDKELVLLRSSLNFDLDLAEDLGNISDVLNDEDSHGGLGIDVENILNHQKFKEFSLDDIAESKDDEWSAKPEKKHNSLCSKLTIHSDTRPRYLPKFASLDRLIDLLIVDPKYFHESASIDLTEYRIVFMLNYSTFVTTKNLLQKLAHRFVHSGNAVISVMKKQYLERNKKYDKATFGAYPNWEFDKEVNLTILGKVDYKLLLNIQTNILKVLILLVNNFFNNFLNDTANKRVMIKLLKLYSNEILQWYNSSKIDRDLDKSFEDLVTYYKRLKKFFVMKSYRPALPSKIDELLWNNYKFTSTLTEVPINRNLPSHKNVQKIEKFLNKFNELLAKFYKGITPQHWFSMFKILECLFENNNLLNYKTQTYDTSEDLLQMSNVYDYLFTLYDSSKDDLVFNRLPLVFQTLLRLYSKFRSYLLIQLCDPLVSDDERLDRMRTLLIMVKICKLKMSELQFVLEGDSGPIPSFIESAIANAIYSPESRYFAKLWVKASASLGTNIDVPSKKFDSLDSLVPNEISILDLATGHEPLLPCIGWIVENMLELNKTPSFSGSLINYNKRYMIFVFIKELIIEEPGELNDFQTESKEFEFLFLLDDNLSHMANVSYDVNENYPRGFLDKVFRKQYYIIATEAQRSSIKVPQVSTENPTVSGPKTLTKKISNSSLRRQSLNFKSSASSKFRLGGLFTKTKGFGLSNAAEKVVSVKDLPSCLSVADPKQKPVLVVPLKDRKIFPVYLLPACFKIDLEGSNELCFLQACSELDAQDWLRKLNYANRHWFQSRTINSKQSHAFTTFGIPLDMICSRDKADVPIVLTTIFSKLEEEGLKDVGIYRIGTSISELNSLKQQIDRTGTINFGERGVDVHALTSCVKLFFRELPDALLTDEVISSLEPFRRNGKESEDFVMNEVQKCKSILVKLPHLNYCTLKALIEHLNKIYKMKEYNKMTPSNLATVIGPALTEASNLDFLINNFGLMNNVLEKLIENYEAIFC